MRSVQDRVTRLLAIAALFSCGIASSPARAEVAQIIVHADKSGAVISRNVYGQFSEHLGTGIYSGIFVGEKSAIPNTRGFRNDVISALKELHVPLVRWPGGCFADYYHWRDGIGPKDRRKVIINGWGNVTDNNAFGTHEFFDFLSLIGAEAYVNANVGTGSPQEAAEWLEYMTGDQDTTLVKERKANGRDEPWKVSIYAVGNETWGCGGKMSAQYYSDLYNQYVTFQRTRPEAQPEALASGDNAADTSFTETLMHNARARMDAISMHYYTFADRNVDTDAATGFHEAGWISILSATLKMDDIIQKKDAIMSAAEAELAAKAPDAPRKKVGLYIDEWGTWFKAEPGTNPGFLVQQNTLRDAVVAAANFNIFHKHADRVRMTSIAQTVNVLQAMILTDGPNMLLTPTYHVFHMYRPFQDAVALSMDLQTPHYTYGKWSVPQVSASAARTKEGAIVIGLANLDPHKAIDISTSLIGTHGGRVRGEILTADAMDAHNTFAAPNAVHPVAFDGAKLAGNLLNVKLPAKSVVVLTVSP